MSTRRGRPRVRRAPVDRGTAELNARRALLVRGADPALAESPLGVLLARGVITADQHAAGCEYGRTVAMALGRKRDLGFDGGGGADEMDDETLAKIEARWRACQEALRRAGAHAKRITELVCVYREMPPWLVRTANGTAGNDDRAWLRAGLDALVNILGGRRR